MHMVESTISVSGATIFWSIGARSNHKVIKDGLLELGHAKYVPEPRTPPAALKDALSEVYTLPTQLIRPLKAKDGFTVVEEQRGEDTNGYATLVTAKIDKDLRIHCDPYSSELSGDLVNRFNNHLGLLRPANVSACLVNLLDSMGATRLRPGGALYWLPDRCLYEWGQIVEVFERSGVNCTNSVYLLRNSMDADTIRAVRDAIITEVQNEAARIDREVKCGDLGERALETRQQQAEELAQKVRMYERILGEGLGNLITAAEKALSAASVAALTLSVATGLVEVA
jgi:hypothetical protein